MSATSAYAGPFEPPPAHLLEGAFGWEFWKDHPTPHTWVPKGWEIIFPDGIRTFTLDGLCVRDRMIYQPTTLEPADA